MPQVDESVVVESVGKQQNSFLNWLQDKLEDEMKTESYKHYIEQEKYVNKSKRCLEDEDDNEAPIELQVLEEDCYEIRWTQRGYCGS